MQYAGFKEAGVGVSPSTNQALSLVKARAVKLNNYISVKMNWATHILFTPKIWTHNIKMEKKWNVYNYISFLLIASAILISSWILLWRHLRPNRVMPCVWIILPNEALSRIIKIKETYNYMTKYHYISCFWAVGFRFVLLILILF